MLNLQRIKNNIHAIFGVLELDEEMSLEYTHNKKVYRIRVEDTGRTYRYKRKKPVSLVDQITPGRCDTCGKLELNGVCVNVSCASQAVK